MSTHIENFISETEGTFTAGDIEKDICFSKIRAHLSDASHILVVSHARPDGDALGSTLAAALWLKQEGHQVTAWNEDGVPEKFSYLPEASLISTPSKTPQDFDAILVLDTAAKSRLGPSVLAAAHAPLWIAIDHHISNERFANFNFIIPTAPATGEILANAFLQEKISMTPAIATNLYVAISTDTGSFQYHNTSARTFEIAAALVDAGVSVGDVSKAMYASQPQRRLELLRHALVHAKFSCNNRVASFGLAMADSANFGILPEDTEGIIDHFRSVNEVIVAAFFEELPENKVRLSLRSKSESFDASLFCQQFGGGGHCMAAGARIEGGLQEVEEKILSAICEMLTV